MLDTDEFILDKPFMQLLQKNKQRRCEEISKFSPLNKTRCTTERTAVKVSQSNKTRCTTKAKVIEIRKLNRAKNMVNFGRCYEEGKGVPKNILKAIQFYKKAASLGYPEGMKKFCMLYKILKQSTNKDINISTNRLARNLRIGLEKLKILNNRNTINVLGMCFQNGIDVPQNMKKAIKLYQQAAKLGNTDAMVNLARCYEEGKGVLKNISKAVKLYQQAADLNNTEAMVNLARCYEKGKGVLRKNIRKAVELYQEAAESGNTDAMINLGAYHEIGEIVPKDIKRAVKLYQKAAKLGNTDAMVELGVYYETSENGDMTKAIKLYRRASTLNNTTAMVNLARCYEEGKVIQKNIPQAIRFYKKAARLGNTNAMYELGCYYASGDDGIEKKENKAFKFFQQSFGIKKKSIKPYNPNNLDHVIKMALAISDGDYCIEDANQWNKYTTSIKQFLEKNFVGTFTENYTIKFKKDGSDLGLIITTKPKEERYFLKIYPYSKETYKEKLTEVEYFKLLGPENSMELLPLHLDKTNNCIIFCSKQALLSKDKRNIELFPKFHFEEIKQEFEKLKKSRSRSKKKKEQLLEKNQEFKNLCQFFKIMIYSAMFNLGDVRDTNVLMALEKQNNKEDIRVKLIDFWLGRYKNKVVLPEKIDIIKRIDGTTEKTIMLNPFLPENNALEDSPSQIFLKQCIYLFLLAQSRENFGTITTPTSQGVCDITKDVLKFIQENPEISKILEEKVLGYIEEVFGKIEELGKEIETISGQPLSGQTTAVSSTTPPLPVQPSCDDTTKSPGTPEQSEEDLKTLLKTKVEILNQFCERYQYIQQQLEKFSQSKTTEKPTEEVKPLPKSETPLPETPKDAKPTSESEQEFTNTTHSVPPTSIVAVAAAASATLATAAVGYANIIAILAAGQVKLEKMRQKIRITQRNIGKKSQALKLAI